MDKITKCYIQQLNANLNTGKKILYQQSNSSNQQIYLNCGNNNGMFLIKNPKYGDNNLIVYSGNETIEAGRVYKNEEFVIALQKNFPDEFKVVDDQSVLTKDKPFSLKIADGYIWVIDGVGKLFKAPVEWIKKAMETKKDNDNKINPNTVLAMAKASKESTDNITELIKRRLQESPNSTIIYDIQGKCWFVKDGNLYKPIPAHKIPVNNPIIQGATKFDGTTHGLKFFNPGTPIWNMFFNSPQYQKAARKLKIKDKTQHKDFMARLFYYFMQRWTGINFNQEEDVNYSKQQLMSFTPFVQSLVNATKNGLPPGTYQFEYNG